MSPAELEAHDLAGRRKTLDAAIADERRGLAIRQAQRASCKSIEANIARLEAARALLGEEHAA